MTELNQSFKKRLESDYIFVELSTLVEKARHIHERSYIPWSASSTHIHSVVKVFEILITFLNYSGFVPNLDRSLFMIKR